MSEQPKHCRTFDLLYGLGERAVKNPDTYVKARTKELVRNPWVNVHEYVAGYGLSLFLKLEDFRALHLAFDTKAGMLAWLARYPILRTLPLAWTTPADVWGTRPVHLIRDPFCIEILNGMRRNGRLRLKHQRRCQRYRAAEWKEDWCNQVRGLTHARRIPNEVYGDEANWDTFAPQAQSSPVKVVAA